MENKKTWTITSLIVASIQLLLQALTVFVVLRLNMLPNDYVVVFILAMILLFEGIALFMFIPVKGQIRLWRRIVSYVLAALIILGCSFVSNVVLNTYRVVNSMVNGSESVHSSYVLVLNESPARTLRDTKGYRYGAIAGYDEEHTQQVVATVEAQIGETLTLTDYPQAAVMADALYNKEVDALIMNGVSISLLIEQETHKDFLTHIRILHTMTFTPEESPDDEFGGDVVTDTFVMYISGSDTRNKKLNVSRSDVNILAVVNPKTRQVLLINTPRDAYVPNSAGKGALDKLTHCGLYGVDCSMETLGNLFDVEVEYYARINFSGFEKLIDAIDGVTVYADESFTTIFGMHFEAGENKLNGAAALQFARERFNVTDGDDGRGKNQMKVIKAVIEKLSSSKTLISNYADIMKSLEGMFATNLEMNEISNLVKMQLNDMSSWNVQSFSVTGTGGYGETYSAPGQELYVTYLSEDAIAYAGELIDRVFAGEQLTADDMRIPTE